MAWNVIRMWGLNEDFRSLWDKIHTPIEDPEDSESAPDFPDEDFEFDDDYFGYDNNPDSVWERIERQLVEMEAGQ